MTEAEPPWITERRFVAAKLAPFYAALAVAVVVVSCLDLFTDQTVSFGDSTFTRRYGSVWALAWADRGGVAGLGIALLLALVVLLARAGLGWVGRPVEPLGIALLGGVLGVMVGFRIGTRTPVPDLAGGGQATIALSVVIVVLGLLHGCRLLFGQPERTPPA